MADSIYQFIANLAVIARQQPENTDNPMLGRSYLNLTILVSQYLKANAYKETRTAMPEYGISISGAAICTSLTAKEFRLAADYFVEMLEKVVASGRLTHKIADEAFSGISHMAVRMPIYKSRLLPVVELVWAELFERVAEWDRDYAIAKADMFMTRHEKGSLLHELAVREAINLRPAKLPPGKPPQP